MISKSSQHALKALIFLSRSEDPAVYWRVEEIAKKIDVPGPYLKKIMKLLAKKGLLISRRGKSGGVRLARKSISFLAVCEALKDPVTESSCFFSEKPCSQLTPCPFHKDWAQIRGEFINFLKRSQLGDAKAERLAFLGRERKHH